VLKHRIIDWDPTPFTVLEVWRTHAEFSDRVSKLWEEYQVTGLLWEYYNNKKQQLIIVIRNLDLDDENNNLRQEGREGREERRKLLAELNVVSYQIEVLAKQKYRTRWLEEGDLNTKFLHIYVKWRRAKNSIKGLPLENGWGEELRE